MKKLLITKSLFLSLILIFTFAISALANTYPTTNRLAGFDRYETASQIARSGWSQSDYAILAYGENYPDALASAPLAKKYNAPILLTSSTSLPSTTKQTLINIQVKNVIIIGGTGVISSSIDSELQSMGMTITRIAGLTQYDTAIKVAEQLPSPSTVFVCTGEDYADALSVAPIAALKQIPIILVPRDLEPDSVKSYLSLNHITKTYVVGYSDIVSDNVCNQLPNPERIVGGDKYARNVAINQKFNNEFSPDGICVASGESFPDALAGASYASKISEPIILINNDSSANTKGYYQQKLANANNVNVFGGTGIISNTVMQGLSSSVVAPTPIVSDVPTGEWNGSYDAGSGARSLVLKVTKVDDNGNYQAIFSFGPSVNNPTSPEGSYKMLGTYDPKLQTLNLAGVQWIKEPANYGMVDMKGTIDLNNSRYKGKIYWTYPRDGELGTFMLTK